MSELPDKVQPIAPTDVKAIQWAKVFKMIRKFGHNGVAVYRLAGILKVPKSSVELEKSLELLQAQGRVRLSLGLTKSGMPCRFVQATDIPRNSEEI